MHENCLQPFACQVDIQVLIKFSRKFKKRGIINLGDLHNYIYGEQANEADDIICARSIKDIIL